MTNRLCHAATGLVADAARALFRIDRLGST